MKRLRLLVPALVAPALLVTVSAVLAPTANADRSSEYVPGGCDDVRAQQGQTFTFADGYKSYVGQYTAGEQILFRIAAPYASIGIGSPDRESYLVYPTDEFRYDVTTTAPHSFSIFSLGGPDDIPPLTLSATCGIPPTVTITNPTADGVTTSGQAVTPGEFSCSGGTNAVALCTSSPEIPETRPGTHTFSVTATDTQGLATTRSVTYTVPRLDQALAFTTEAPVGATWGRTPYSVGARSTSGLPVTITVDPDSTGCTAPAGTASPTVPISLPRPGTCIVHADQGGDDTYLPATRVTQQFEVGRLKSYLTAIKASKGLLGLTPTTFRAEVDSDQFFGPSPVAAGYPGQEVTFWVGGVKMCSARSVAVAGGNALFPDAVATCKATIGFTNASKTSYTATYGGDSLYLPSTATGLLQ